jgi:hypothetical protein
MTMMTRISSPPDRRLDFSLSRTHRQVSEEIRYMNAIASTPIDAEAKNAPTSGRLFFLDLIVVRRLLEERRKRHCHEEGW